MSRITQLTYIIILTILLVACSVASQLPTSTAAPSLVISNSSTAPAGTEGPIPSPTVSFIPTLPVEQAEMQLLSLLGNNGGCGLPCLWGVNPAHSSDEGARDVFAPLSSLSELGLLRPGDGGSLSMVYTEDDRWLVTNIGYNSENQVVTKLSIRLRELQKKPTTDNGVEFEPIFNSSTFGERADFYMLHSVLTNHGRPDSVMLGTLASVPPRQAPGNFHILLLYPEQGMLIEYTTEMFKLGSSVRGCPANAHVEMDLFPPGDADTFFTHLESTNGEAWAVKQNWYQHLEETTSLTLDEFYELFRVPTDQCIETLASLWPTSDP